MDPTRNFVKYRNLLKGSDRPLIPYFPVAKKDLYLGNDSMVDNMVRRLCCIPCVYNQMFLENYPLWNIIAYSNIVFR